MANLDLGHLEKKDPKNPEMKLGCVELENEKWKQFSVLVFHNGCINFQDTIILNDTL